MRRYEGPVLVIHGQGTYIMGLGYINAGGLPSLWIAEVVQRRVNK